MNKELSISRRITARIVYYFHMLVTFFVPCAWILPWKEAWIIGAILIPIILINWLISDVCILSTLEMKIRGNPNAGTMEQGSFIQRLGHLINWNMTDKTMNRIAWSVTITGLLLCIFRLFQWYES